MIKVSEITPSFLRGALCCFHTILVTFAVVCTYFVGVMVPNGSSEYYRNNSFEWRFPISIPSILSLLQIILLFFIYKIDSPVYYFQLSLAKEMEEALDRLYENEEDKKIVRQEIMSIEQVESKVSLYEKYKWAFWVGISMSAIQQLSGLFLMIFNAPEVFSKQGDSQAQILSLVISLINFFAAFSVSFTSESIFMFLFRVECGRRLLLIGGGIGCGVALLILFSLVITMILQACGYLILVLSCLWPFLHVALEE